MLAIYWFFITAHDCMHNSVCPTNTQLNRTIGQSALLLYAGLQYNKLLEGHILHHSDTATDLDPDYHPQNDGSETFLGVKWYFSFLKSYLTWHPFLWMSFWFTLFDRGLGIPIEAMWCCWLAPQILSTVQLFYFGTYLPHRGTFDANAFPARSNNYPHWISLLTCFHFGYHFEHHKHPYVPWWYLPTISYTVERNMIALLLLPLLPLLILCLNLLSWNRPSGQCQSSDSRVSVLIPVRNEELNIEKCIEHIYNGSLSPFEVIVYNDNSTDGTLSILQQLQAKYPSLQVLQGGPLPKGWAGKNHACHHLSVQASGDVLLFLDADTEIQPHGIGHLLHTIEDEKLPSDMVSALPKQIMGTWGERMLMPFLPLTILSWLPLEFVRRLPFPSMTVAIGQVVMIRVRPTKIWWF